MEGAKAGVLGGRCFGGTLTVTLGSTSSSVPILVTGAAGLQPD